MGESFSGNPLGSEERVEDMIGQLRLEFADEEGKAISIDCFCANVSHELSLGCE